MKSNVVQSTDSTWHDPVPIVTYGVVAICWLVQAAESIHGVSLFDPSPHVLADWGGNWWPATTGGQWWRLVTSGFVHMGILHLALNSWALWGLGRNTERVYGSLTFGVLTGACLVLSSLASIWINPHNIVSVGASGAVFGVMGLQAGFLVRRHADAGFETWAWKPLMLSIFGFLALNGWLAYKSGSIDLAAHAGGIVAGFLLGLVAAPSVGRPPPGWRCLACGHEWDEKAVELPLLPPLDHVAPGDASSEMVAPSVTEGPMVQ